MSSRAFLSRLLAISDHTSAQIGGGYMHAPTEMTNERMKYYMDIMDKRTEAVAESRKSGEPLNPIIQLLFNFEDIIDNVYTSAKCDAIREMMLDSAAKPAVESAPSNFFTGDASPYTGVTTVTFDDILHDL